MLALLAATSVLAVAVGVPVPGALTTLERVAEGIDDAVVAHDWAKVAALELEGDGALRTLQTERVAARQRAVEALAEARAATRTRNALRTRFASNRLAGAVVEFYEPLHPNVPTSVMRLDVLLRTIDLDALDVRPVDARAALDRVQTIWRDVAGKPPVHGSPAEHSFADELAAVERASAASDLPALHQAAVAALEGVDSLEKQFK